VRERAPDLDLTRLREQPTLEDVAQERGGLRRRRHAGSLDASILERAIEVLEAACVLATRHDEAVLVLEVEHGVAEADRGVTAARVAFVRADVEVVEAGRGEVAGGARADRRERDRDGECDAPQREAS
jgi:hypothetical protein